MPVVYDPTPAWLKPENASVFDSPWTRIARRAARVVGADDPVAQIMGVTTTEVPGGATLADLAEGIRGYHGSPRADLTHFDPNTMGIPQKGDSSALGTFFSREQEAAQHYTTRAGQGPGRVYPADISGKLYPLSRDEFASVGSRGAFRALRERLAAAGYDGVDIPHLGEIAVWNADAMRPAVVGTPPPVLAPKGNK